MNAAQVAVVRRWLRENRGDETQEGLAAAITASTPDWNITRDRYSKYESGPLPIGPGVLAHFVGYWQSRGVAGPDFTPPDPEPTREDRLFAALERQTEAIGALAAAIEQERKGRASWERGLLESIRDLVGRGAGPSDDLVPQLPEGAQR